MCFLQRLFFSIDHAGSYTCPGSLGKALPEWTFEGALNVQWTFEEQPTEAERRAAEEALFSGFRMTVL